MIVLSETTDNLQVVLTTAHTTNALQVYTAWRRRTSTTFLAGRTLVNTNGTTDINASATPAASEQVIIDYLSVYNSDTASKVVIVKIDANGTEVKLFQATLATGEKLEYAEGSGFQVITTSGSAKQSINQGNSPVSSIVNEVVLVADVTNNNAVANTLQDVTGLSFPVIAGNRYRFKFVVDYTAAATTTGSRWTINGPATPTRLIYESDYSLTTTSRTLNTGLTAYQLPAASNATSAATGGNMVTVEGFITPSQDGTVQLQFASEVAGSAIVAKIGSYCEYKQVA